MIAKALLQTTHGALVLVRCCDVLGVACARQTSIVEFRQLKQHFKQTFYLSFYDFFLN